MRIPGLVVVASFVLAAGVTFVAGCGDDAPKRDAAGAAARSSAGSTAGASAGAVASCLSDLGFASVPPSHGVAEQWRAPGATIVARSADPEQSATVASEIGDGEVVGGSGYVIAGGGPLASAAETCVTLADA